MPRTLRLWGAILLWCSLTIPLFAQSGFSQADFAFFRQKQAALQDWLRYEGFADYLQFDRIDYNSASLEVSLVPTAFTDDCAYLSVLWTSLQRGYYLETKDILHITLMEGIAFVMEVPEDSLTLRLHCRDAAGYQVYIFGERDGNGDLSINLTTQGEVQKMSPDGEPIVVPVDQLKPSLRRHNQSTQLRSDATYQNQLTIRKVSNAVESYLTDFYADKGTPILYRARPKVSRSYYNHFKIRVTHLSHVVLPEVGFFEYHEYTVKVRQEGEKITVEWDFLGKYGDGRFVPRSNSY
ncbi:MAG: hypothetical protein AAF828_01175, partial [Bacteroidota bacterium]